MGDHCVKTPILSGLTFYIKSRCFADSAGCLPQYIEHKVPLFCPQPCDGWGGYPTLRGKINLNIGVFGGQKRPILMVFLGVFWGIFLPKTHELPIFTFYRKMGGLGSFLTAFSLYGI